MPLISIAGTVRDRIKQRMVLLSITHLLERMGLKIVPFYVTRESLFDREGPDFEPDLKPVVSGFLSPAEIESLYAEPEIKSLPNETHKWKEDDSRCFALKHNDEIVAYMWCNLSFCNSDIVSFPLQPDEAYLFRARTMNAYRGRNLAPFLRYQLYRSLVGMGRTRYYSITESFNTPAVNFKKKLKARQIRLCLHFGLFGKIRWNITLKHYRDKL